MILYSTNNPENKVSLKQAVIQGLADDGGLYIPEKIPKLSPDFFKTITKLSFSEIAFEVSKKLLQGAVPEQDLKKLVKETINFDAPLVKVEDNLFALELFHGPTLAFKDFGARFMSRLLRYFIQKEKKNITVLVATSGDTGSAVAHGFLNIPGIKVVLLYPSGKVSKLQEQQLTTMGSNITALEVDGVFDDCQNMVKQAFNDLDLKNLNLTSANSINIARLIPQSFYYFYAYAQLKKLGYTKAPIFSVPSGNFGNITAGMIAKKMGLEVNKFIAAVNINDTFPRYLASGQYKPQASKQTISNAMDVGNPSNFIRLKSLGWDKGIWSKSFTDKETQTAMEKVQYQMDPHGAVGYLGLKAYQQQNQKQKDHPQIFLETAHPAKFLDTVEIPKRLAQYMHREKKSIKIDNKFSALKKFLCSSSSPHQKPCPGPTKPPAQHLANQNSQKNTQN